ncbi:hypothetical protein NEOLEDRAFT_1082390 [Neolentinus lepideus HHB14362 ss-1]|uniref:Sphingolipid long chain base-responsive protein LSP1 n=1 Tax=Neolentinus lepideus HHB14362 ss-1 TaxID=1314782 RepID=A0A165VZQ8_9AGAM|nr:hypothetical protein NEOLEDRAFT_1082390 [Neolentinus lepideus HHB14362 ss-1]
MSGFLSSFADKAQSAIQSSGLTQHIPGGYGRATSPGSSDQGAGRTAHRSHALEAFQHQLRAFGQQYSSSTTPVQKIITSEKGVALDFDRLAQDSKGQSKELYMWGQNEGQDIKDVTDRIAHLNYLHGCLAETLATKLDAARAPAKALRDAENSLAPRRGIRSSLENQIGRIENDQPKGMEKRLAELKQQLAKAQQDDEGLEKQVEILKRKALRESESLKWAALREYGEKLSLLTQASEGILSHLPSVPPSTPAPYTGLQATGEIRATLQYALDNYRPGQIDLYTYNTNPSNLRKSDTRTFGETHASELSSIHSDDASVSTRPSIPITPPGQNVPLPTSPAISTRTPSTPSQHSDLSVKSGSPGTNRATSPAEVSSPPLNPALLNQAPAPIPIPYLPPAANSSPAVPVDPMNPTKKAVAITPTVAETGMPVSAGADGPGPASGSLKDLKSPISVTSAPRGGLLPVTEVNTPAETPATGPTASAAGSYESAEDEKKRLEREERERILSEGGSGLVATRPEHETADEEKKRLEREERERLLRGETTTGAGHGRPQDEDELPPYQDISPDM